MLICFRFIVKLLSEMQSSRHLWHGGIILLDSWFILCNNEWERERFSVSMDQTKPRQRVRMSAAQNIHSTAQLHQQPVPRSCLTLRLLPVLHFTFTRTICISDSFSCLTLPTLLGYFQSKVSEPPCLPRTPSTWSRSWFLHGGSGSRLLLKSMARVPWEWWRISGER